MKVKTTHPKRGPGKLVAELAHQRGGQYGADRRWHADDDAAGRRGTQCSDRAPRSRRAFEHTARMQFEDFSGLAQHDAAPGAMVEFRAQLLLERLDLPAQDRLAGRCTIAKMI